VAFLEAICTAADDRDDPVRIVLGLRDDFLGRVAETPEAREALSRLMVLRAPGPEALEETLVRPVAAAGYAYEDPSVVREMVAAVGTEPAGLPLLQFAAHALWERRDRASRLLRRSAYEAMGGVPGALADHADGVLEELAPGEIQLARAILLRLVTPQRTRGVLRRGRLLDGLPSEAERILDRLARARLVTVRATSGYGPQEPEIELAHESIIGAWKRLARWLDESAGEHAWLAEVRPVAERWERRGRRAEEVWRGEVLRESARMLARCGAPVPTAVCDFLEAGQRVERRRQTRRRALWAGALAALVAVTAASVWGALAFREKERQARHRWADVQQEAARAAMLRGEMLEAMARLRGSLEIRDSLLGRALWNDLAQAPLLGTWRLSGSAFAAALSPDGRTLAVAGQDKAVHLFDLPTWLPRVLRGVDEQYQSVAFSPDGRRLAAGTIGGPVVVWDLLSGRFQQLSGHVGRVFGVAFHPTGRWLASAGLDGQIRLRDLDGGSPPRILRGHRGRVNRLAFHPRRGLLASAGVDGSVRIWDVDAGTPPRVLSGHTDTVFDVAFDPAGTRLASGSYDGTARIWDVTTGFAPTGVLDPGEPVYPVAFSRDGRLLASGGHSGSIRLWDARTRTPAAVLDAPPTRVWGLAFDTRRLISASEDGGVRLWSLRARAVAPPRAGHRGAVVDLAFAADGSRIASASYDGTVRLWDARSGRQLRVLRGHTHRVFGVAIDDRRGLLASGGSDGTIRLWDLASGAVRKVLSGPTDLVFDVVFHPHRELLLSAGLDRVVRLWDLHTGALRRELAGHRDRISSLDVSLDGRLVASASYDGTLRVWDLVAGGPPRILAGHEGAIDGVAFDPTGRYLASASQDRSVRLWDLGSGKGRIVGRHPARVYRVAFHPRGEWLASAGSDGTARLWNLRGSSRILRGHRSEVNHVAFAPDGAHLATASDDGTVRWWTFPEGRPAWRAPALFASSLELATHRGWVALGEGARLRGDRWRRAIEREARWASESGAFLCVATFDDRVALWDKASDRPLWAHVAPGVRQIVGAPGECLVVAGEEALRYRPGGSTLLARPARAVAERGGRILIAQEASLILLEPSGARRTWAAKRPGLTAVALAGGTAYAGHEAGSLERHSLSGPASGEHLTLEDAPASPVTRILPGPRDTLIVGFANGTVGVWTADGAASLMQARLHGPIAHLAWKDAKLHVATELGDYATIDLRSLGAPYCDLLREVWRWVGEAWEGGRSVSRPPPPDHPCWRARSE
jgi:WD40 repeat protein